MLAKLDTAGQTIRGFRQEEPFLKYYEILCPLSAARSVPPLVSLDDNLFRIMTMSTAILETSRPAAVDVPSASSIPERRTLAATIVDLHCGVLVRIEGDLGIASLEKLQFAFARVIARRTLLAVLDLSQVTFLSSLGMGLLVRLSRDLGRWNGRVKIANCPPATREALEVARLMDFFQFHATVDEALSSL